MTFLVSTYSRLTAKVRKYEAILGSRELFLNQRIKAVALERHPQALARRGKTGLELEQISAQLTIPRAQNLVILSGLGRR